MADIERIILCVDNQEDWELYAATLPLYFPRSTLEAQAVIRFASYVSSLFTPSPGCPSASP